MDVGLDHPLDPQVPQCGLLQVDADVAAGIDDHRPPGALIADQVGGVGQAGQVVLGQDHLNHLPGWTVRQQVRQAVGLFHFVLAGDLAGCHLRLAPAGAGHAPHRANDLASHR